jgi:hypothetical protein
MLKNGSFKLKHKCNKCRYTNTFIITFTMKTNTVVVTMTTIAAVAAILAAAIPAFVVTPAFAHTNNGDPGDDYNTDNSVNEQSTQTQTATNTATATASGDYSDNDAQAIAASNQEQGFCKQIAQSGAGGISANEDFGIVDNSLFSTGKDCS